MGSTGDKMKGMAEEAKGNIKQGIAEVTGDPNLHAEGVQDERRGEARQTVGKAKDAVKRTVDRI
ncbi:CsbD family protein [Chthonobacter rhizosphaerae]|uniref:CsbD family protein n=1 Tax=Chthonobacter rhizosphaerae TaxID=2735553 RepID=UPI0015EE94E8|nr:CsbD family protein [Chthonobacter rhizosphaerae]